MSRIKRIHIPVTLATVIGSGEFRKLSIPAFGYLVGVATRPFPIDAAQSCTVTVDATGGTFSVIRNGSTVSGIATNCTAATLETALNADSAFGVCTVTRSGSINAYVYTITFGATSTFNAAGVVQRPGIGYYLAVTTGAGSLSGGASTATVVNTGGTPVTSTADIIVLDHLTGVALLSDLSWGGASYYVPSQVMTDNAGVAITAAAGHNIDTLIPVSGPLDVFIANGTNGDKGSLWLLVKE